jgi:hypothetical protein
MAVRHGYGKIAGTDALVFAYDTGDTRNSYRGEPTANLQAAGGAFGHNSGAYGNVVTVTDATSEKGPGWKKVTISNRGSNSRIIQFTYTSMTANIMYCHSAVFDWGNMRDKGYYINHDGSGTGQRAFYKPGNYTAAQGASISINSSLEDGKIAGTIIHTASHTHAFFINNNTTGVSGLNDYFYYKEYQVETNTHPTQYTSGTRSATQGLLDLTGNRTIDLTNVKFDSNAQPVFDGTNDTITVGTGILSGTGDFTVEAVIQSDYQEVNGTIFANYPAGNLQTFFSGRYIGLYLANNSAYLGSSPFTTVLPEFTTNPIHFLALREGTETRVYLNGVLKKTGSSSSTIGDTSAAFRVGTNTNGTEDFLGDIFIVKAYNRALTAAEVQSNFKNYKKRFEGLDYYYDNTTDGGRWIRFWWYTGVGWPGHETAALGHPFGTFDSSNHYGFQRLPAGLTKSQVELLAKDGSGNVYKWDFANDSSTAQRVWDSMTAGTQGVFANGGAFNPTVIAGAFHGVQQDSWQYRVSEGVASFLLDDDTCDCVSTLNAGHAMCGGSGWNQQYAQPDGAYLRYGVDTLNDGGCLGPVPTRQLELYYRIKQ